MIAKARTIIAASISLTLLQAAAALPTLAAEQPNVWAQSLDPEELAHIVMQGLKYAGQTQSASAESLRFSGVTEYAGIWFFSPEGAVELRPLGTGSLSSSRSADLVLYDNYAARETEDGAQSIAVLASPDAPMPSWQLSLPESMQAELSENGGIIFRTIDDDLNLIHEFMIESPWAVDAEGKYLATHYELLGDTIVQHVDTEGAVFPIVADPRLTFGLGVYLNMTGAEIAAVATAIVGAGGVAAVATCSGAARLPHVVAKVAAVACTAIGAPTLKTIYHAILAINKSIDHLACYQMNIVKIVPKTATFKKVKAAGNCI